MDGNGRWARTRGLPRVAGHKRGVEAVRATLEACVERGIEYLTLFAFSSENWRRPPDEVSTLMRLFMVALQREVDKLIELGVRMRVVGETFAFDPDLRRLIAQIGAAHRAQHTSASDDLRQLRRALGHRTGSRARRARAARRRGRPTSVSMRMRSPSGSALSFAPEPDLLIRTGGERRVSNFLLWQLAYAELYFSDVLWPDFDAAELDAALHWYAGRQRRFGMTGEQVEAEPSIPRRGLRTDAC